MQLGWIGSHSTVPFLESLAPVLARLRARHPGLRLIVIGATSDRFGDMIEAIPWTLAGEVAALSRIDIGRAPLPPSAWSRGKCGLKLLQYLALEIERHRCIDGAAVLSRCCNGAETIKSRHHPSDGVHHLSAKPIT